MSSLLSVFERLDTESICPLCWMDGLTEPRVHFVCKKPPPRGAFGQQLTPWSNGGKQCRLCGICVPDDAWRQLWAQVDFQTLLEAQRDLWREAMQQYQRAQAIYQECKGKGIHSSYYTHVQAYGVAYDAAQSLSLYTRHLELPNDLRTSIEAVLDRVRAGK